jgi:type IX secretion system PorP/SprF family membrane protein
MTIGEHSDAGGRIAQQREYCDVSGGTNDEYMRVSLVIVALSVLCGSLHAQYVPNSGQAFQFASAYNPSFTGVESYGDLKLGYRYQWTGFKEYAPKFVNLVYNVRIKQPLDLTLNALRTSQSGARGKMMVPRSRQLIHGLGLSLFNEKVGLIERLGGGVNYALHYPVTNTMRMSMGVSAILENTKLDAGEIYLGANADPDPFYENLMKGSNNHTELTVRAGLLLYSDRFYIGASYFPLWNTSIKTSDLNFDELFYRGSAQAGLAFPLSADVILKPSVMALLQTDNDFLIDYSLKAFLQRKAWLGVTYRDIKNGIVSGGFTFNDMFAVSYSYEFSMGKIKQFSGGSHEVVLSVRLNNFKHQNQQTW